MSIRQAYWELLFWANIILACFFAAKGDNHVFMSIVMVAFCGYILEGIKAKLKEEKDAK